MKMKKKNKKNIKSDFFMQIIFIKNLNKKPKIKNIILTLKNGNRRQKEKRKKSTKY
jgi:hypothetical protein